MKTIEFGDTANKKLILIHGFQHPWQVWNAYIEHFKNDYHIIVPVLSGHDPDKKEDFVSFDADAKARGTARISMPFTVCRWAAYWRQLSGKTKTCNLRRSFLTALPSSP